MFLGHYGVAFAAKRVAPRTSLGALSFAAQFLDELWPILLLLGIEQVRIVPGLMNASPLNFVYYPFSWAWWVDKHRSPIAKIDAGTAQYPSTL